MKKLLFLITIILIASFVISLSQTDATNIISKQNNYLLTNETAVVYKPAVPITYQNNDYWVIAGIQDNTVNVYIPLNNETRTLADGAIEKRKLIETEIVLSKIYQLKNSSYGLYWPFSHSMRSSYDDYKRVFGDMVPKVISVRTELEAISGASSLELKADNVQASFESLSMDAEEIGIIIEESRLFEEKYFNEPDTNQTSKYEKYFETYFDAIDDYKTNYFAVEAAVSELKAEIAAFPGSSSQQKEFFLTNLGMPPETQGLKELFNKADQLKTFVESLFNESKNIESFIGNLETRKSRNDSWKEIYGPNDKLTKAGSEYNITTLEGAASVILSSSNISNWEEQEAVDALSTNWNQATSRYERGDYDKAKNFAEKAQNNAETVLEGKYVIAEAELPQDLIIQVVIVLVIILAIVFVYEKFIKKKNDDGQEGYEDYAEYQDYTK
jgi:hypothetical protein